MATPIQDSPSELDVIRVRQDFPILQRTVRDKPLVYLDSAATTQKPKQVLDALANYYAQQNANIHRGVHTLSQEATEKFEQARQIIQTHFNIRRSHEVIFTSGTTHSINLVAFGFGTILEPGDEVIVSALEHHANIVPWQMMCERSGAILLEGTEMVHVLGNLLTRIDGNGIFLSNYNRNATIASNEMSWVNDSQ